MATSDNSKSAPATPASQAATPAHTEAVTAATPIRHGDASGIRDIAEGEGFEASRKAAEQLRAVQAIRGTGEDSKAVEDQAAQAKPGDAAAIDKANAKADADRGKTAAKEAKDLT